MLQDCLLLLPVWKLPDPSLICEGWEAVQATASTLDYEKLQFVETDCLLSAFENGDLIHLRFKFCD